MTQGARSIRRYIPPLLFDAPDFRRLWFGQTISVFGDQITHLGLPLVAVLTLGADATQMGTLTAVGLFPHLLFSLPAGVWLDRRGHPQVVLDPDGLVAAAGGARQPVGPRGRAADGLGPHGADQQPGAAEVEHDPLAAPSRGLHHARARWPSTRDSRRTGWPMARDVRRCRSRTHRPHLSDLHRPYQLTLLPMCPVWQSPMCPVWLSPMCPV